MQSLAKTYLSFFEQLIRQKGRQLFQAGRCSIQKGEPGVIKAACEDGEDKYSLGARLHGGELHVHCQCPYFQARTGFCRHLWAMMLSVDQRGFTPLLETEGQEAEETGDKGLIADEIWLDRSPVEADAGDENRSWKSLINNVERIKKSQERLVFKPKVHYILDISADNYSRTVLELIIAITATELSAEEGNPFFNVPMERLLPLLKHHDAEIFMLVMNNCATDPMGTERKFRLPLSVEPRLAILLAQCSCTVSFGGVPRGHLQVDEAGVWEIILKIEDSGSYSTMAPLLVRGAEKISLDKAEHFILAYPRGFYSGAVRHHLKDNVDNVWLQALEAGPPSYVIPVAGIRDFLAHFSKACSGLHPRVEWPENFWTLVELEAPPAPVFQLEFTELGITGELLFEYKMDPPQRLSAFAAQTQVLQWATRRSCLRQAEAELKVIESLKGVPHLLFVEEDLLFHIDQEHVQEVLASLQEQGVILYGKERKIKTYSKIHLELSTKTDWFEVKGRVEFQNETISVGDMLEAIRNNSRFVLLSSGEYGLLPEKWISRNRHLLETAQAESGGLKVLKNQFLLLKQMAEDEGDKSVEVASGKGRKELNALVKMANDFTGIQEAKQPTSFKGKMRSYQLSGLAWLGFLKKFQFGGILADDMGLGKTIQAIASMLDEKSAKDKNRSSLLVVPTSLVFNWMDEAKRFAPALRMRPFVGGERGDIATAAREADMLLTTYGILRRQAEEFAKIHWHYLILDEAQAIKNYKSQIATAACRLPATHRLSLTGTPIENNLLELWSHMQFLNPSMLGSRDQFMGYLVQPEGAKEEKRNLQRLQKIIFPFILRRTKEDVLSDLPPKVEQVVHCTMGSRQEEYYNLIRDEFRQALLDNIGTRGVGGSKLKVIEGLLRLRQVACHPSLVDRNLSIPSTKLKHLLSSVQEVIAEGHKVLVFSQFTSMLELIVREFTSEGVRFTYLDGQTRDRQERVKAFQNDPDIQVFLISLKAGGTGLNLTAADYVFLYDPWWNPAAEQQAIDRTHRIGQTRTVFTYRLIVKNTVEEKVVELQQHKRKLVDDLLGGGDDGDFIKQLSKQDIEFLFS